MGLQKKVSTPASTMKNQRRKPSHAGGWPEGGDFHRSATHVDGGASVIDKLEALKSLVPSENPEEINADQLFQETADYIVLLKTQVIVLQKLIDFYGSHQENRNSV